MRRCGSERNERFTDQPVHNGDERTLATYVRGAGQCGKSSLTPCLGGKCVIAMILAMMSFPAQLVSRKYKIDNTARTPTARTGGMHRVTIV